jgi:uncharacterized protein related to proFAR isomerase
MTLATKKTEESVETTETKVAATSFTKEKLLQSKRYKKSVDLLKGQLKDDQKYTLDEVDDLIKKFKKVKG